MGSCVKGAISCKFRDLGHTGEEYFRNDLPCKAAKSIFYDARDLSNSNQSIRCIMIRFVVCDAGIGSSLVSEVIDQVLLDEDS